MSPTPSPSDRVEQVGDRRPRLIVVESLVLTAPADPYYPPKALAEYSGCSVRWLRDRLSDALHPLPHYRVVGKLLVRRSEFDGWIARYRQTSAAMDVQRAVDDVLRSFPGA
jgi:hypothetical protein